MDYSEADYERMVNEVITAEAEGRTRKATKVEVMQVRLAALSALVKNMQVEMDDIVQNEKERELAHA